MAGPYPQYSEPPSYPYPSAVPPPVPDPGRRRWRLALAILLVVAVVAAATTAIVYAVTAGPKTASGTGQLTASSAKTAIQNYLDALMNGDTETVARNAGCGFYDALNQKRSDQALARVASQAFRKQFSKAEVTAIDKMVVLSEHQAQVLFTMHVEPVMRTVRERDEQGSAQLLSADNQLFVCQYVLRSGSQF